MSQFPAFSWLNWNGSAVWWQNWHNYLPTGPGQAKSEKARLMFQREMLMEVIEWVLGLGPGREWLGRGKPRLPCWTQVSSSLCSPAVTQISHSTLPPFLHTVLLEKPNPEIPILQAALYLHLLSLMFNLDSLQAGIVLVFFSFLMPHSYFYMLLCQTFMDPPRKISFLSWLLAKVELVRLWLTWIRRVHIPRDFGF